MGGLRLKCSMQVTFSDLKYLYSPFHGTRRRYSRRSSSGRMHCRSTDKSSSSSEGFARKCAVAIDLNSGPIIGFKRRREKKDKRRRGPYGLPGNSSVPVGEQFCTRAGTRADKFKGGPESPAGSYDLTARL
jgi:hypothetical protein